MVLDAIAKADQQRHYDFLILSGDLSYANGDQAIWDKWGNMIQPLASRFPFMMAPGNHEAITLFIPYIYRFLAPDNGYDNLYYSFNYRNVHVLVLNSESLNEFHWSPMYQFAKSDLESVNRQVTPWYFNPLEISQCCSGSLLPFTILGTAVMTSTITRPGS